MILLPPCVGFPHHDENGNAIDSKLTVESITPHPKTVLSPFL